MAREKTVPVAMMNVMKVKDVNGNEVEIPMLQNSDLSVPLPDVDGKVPEFVNISGRVQLMVIPNNPNKTIRVDPWGILRGSQWRSHSEPAPAWGNTPFFAERERNGNGEFDSKYLLSEKQVVDLVTRLNNPDPDLGAMKRLEGFEANGKVRNYDKAGKPIAGDVTEDRSNVISAIVKQMSKIKKLWDVEQVKRGMNM